MNLGQEISDLYWSLKDRRLIEHFNKKPDCYFLYLPRRTRKAFVDIYIKAGALSEKARQAGIGHLLEHYIAELALKKLPPGCELGAKINDNYILFYLEAEDTNALLRGTDAFLSVLLNPDFSREEIFDYEKRSLMNELEKERNDIELGLERVIEKSRYIDEPHQRSFVDHLGTLEDISIADIAAYHKDILTTGNLKIFISAVKPVRKLRDAMEGKMRDMDLPGGYTTFPEPRYSDFRIYTVIEPRISGNYAVMTFPSPSRSASLKDQIILSLLIETILGSGNSGIRQRIREKGIYEFDAVRSQGIRNGYLAMRSYLRKDQIVPWMKTINEVISSLKRAGPDPVLFNAMKKKWTMETLAYWRSNQGRFKILVDFTLDQEGLFKLEEIKEMITSIREEDIRGMARKIFKRKYANVIFYGEDTGISREELERLITFA